MDVYVRKTEDKYKKLDIRSQFSQVYNNALGVVSKVSAPSALHLIFWIISNMDDENKIRLRKEDKKDFISDSGNVYSISAVNKAIRLLSDNNILISYNSEKERSGVYIVNPVYFWKNKDQKKRKQLSIEVIKLIKKNENN